jgi:CheY-like chemotaxis protein
MPDDPDVILVIEDIPAILELLEVTLRFKGYRVLTACNGEEALARIAQERPRLIITDILMPRMDGYALAFKLRTMPETTRIPIIFLSATFVTPEDKDFALSLGAVRFLEKPVDTEEFLLTVAEVLTENRFASAPPLDERQFLTGYRRRLEVKLHHKNMQISRTKRLLEDLPDTQRRAYLDLLTEVQAQRDQIQTELDEINRQLV